MKDVHDRSMRYKVIDFQETHDIVIFHWPIEPMINVSIDVWSRVNPTLDSYDFRSEVVVLPMPKEEGLVSEKNYFFLEKAPTLTCG